MSTLSSKLLSLTEGESVCLSESEITRLCSMVDLLGKLEMLEYIKDKAGYSCEKETEELMNSLLVVGKEIGMLEVYDAIVTRFGFLGLDDDEIKKTLK